MNQEEDKMDSLVEMLSQLIIKYTRITKGDKKSC